MRCSFLSRLVLTCVLAGGLLNVPAARAGIAESAETARPLARGAAVPDVTLKTLDGADFSLKKETAGQLTVLIFYRGGWCPFCNRHLADVQKIQEDLTKLGYRVLAVSPDGAADLKATADKEHLTYTLLSDSGLKAIEAFGLGFKLDTDTVSKYKEYGVKLTGQRDGRYVLPVPAMYLLGKDGKIGFSHHDPDYQKRFGNDELLKVARELAGK